MKEYYCFITYNGQIVFDWFADEMANGNVVSFDATLPSFHATSIGEHCVKVCQDYVSKCFDYEPSDSVWVLLSASKRRRFIRSCRG